MVVDESKPFHLQRLCRLEKALNVGLLDRDAARVQKVHDVLEVGEGDVPKEDDGVLGAGVAVAQYALKVLGAHGQDEPVRLDALALGRERHVDKVARLPKDVQGRDEPRVEVWAAPRVLARLGPGQGQLAVDGRGHVVADQPRLVLMVELQLELELVLLLLGRKTNPYCSTVIESK